MGKAARIRASRKIWHAKPDPSIVATGVYSWESQAGQFDEVGEPGPEHRVEFSGDRPINCFLFRDKTRRLFAIGYHYPMDMGDPPGSLEKAGNVNIWVKPSEQRKGYGTLLLAWIEQSVGPINFRQQRYSTEGATLVNKYLDMENDLRAPKPTGGT